MPVSFQTPAWLYVGVVLAIVSWCYRKSSIALAHPNVSIHSNLTRKSRLLWLTRGAKVLTLLMVTIALSRPQLANVSVKNMLEARDIALMTDVSGSMSAEIADSSGIVQWSKTYQDTPSTERKITKAIIAEAAVALFLKQRQGDRISCLMFEDKAYNMYPLTSDLSAISRCENVVAKYSGSGTNIADALRLGLGHLLEFGEAKSRVLVLITDGEAAISKEDFAELVALQKAVTAKLYVIGIGGSWQGAATADIRQWISDNGGKIFLVANGGEFEKAFSEIDKLEKSNVKAVSSVNYQDLFGWCIALALFFAIIYLTSSAWLGAD